MQIPPLTPVPTSRFGEACEFAARGTLVARYEFTLTGVEDWTTLGQPEVWVDYTATNKETGVVHEEAFGCIFEDMADPADITLRIAVAGGRPLEEMSVEVLNGELLDAGFRKGPR